MAVIAAMGVLVAGCGVAGRAGLGLIARGEDPTPLDLPSGATAGYVVANDVAAVDSASVVLLNGGSPADAAAALALSLSVTQPGAAALGGGGVCLYYDRSEKLAVSVDFLPRVPESDGPVAVPGLLRGLALLHQRWGRLPWAQVVAPAERLAADGHRVSPVLAARGALARRQFDRSPDLRALLSVGAAGTPQEGALLVQPALGALLSQIRALGPESFYTRQPADVLVEGISLAGGTVQARDLQLYRAAVATPERVDGRTRTVFLPAERTGSGALMRDLWAEVDTIAPTRRDNPELLATDLRSLTNAALSAYGVRRAAAFDTGSTSFIIAGGEGDAVACGLTMGGPFGEGSVGARDGVVHARTPRAGQPSGLAGAFLSPVIAIEPESGTVHFVGAGAGAGRAPALVTLAALASLSGPGMNMTVVMNANGADARNQAHALSCRGGYPTCVAAPDPHFHGVARKVVVP